MDIQTPEGWRKGQTVWNFLNWMDKVKEIPDIFHLSDEAFDDYWEEYLVIMGEGLEPIRIEITAKKPL